MSNNSLWCSRCKSYHHPIECPLDMEKPIPKFVNKEDKETLIKLAKKEIAEWEKFLRDLKLVKF